jgi:hypothetical protein
MILAVSDAFFVDLHPSPENKAVWGILREEPHLEMKIRSTVETDHRASNLSDRAKRRLKRKLMGLLAG